MSSVSDLEHSKAKPQDTRIPSEIEHNHHLEADHEHGYECLEVARVVFVAWAAAVLWIHHWEPLHRFSVIGLRPQ